MRVRHYIEEYAPPLTMAYSCTSWFYVPDLDVLFGEKQSYQGFSYVFADSGETLLHAQLLYAGMEPAVTHTHFFFGSDFVCDDYWLIDTLRCGLSGNIVGLGHGIEALLRKI